MTRTRDERRASTEAKRATQEHRHWHKRWRRCGPWCDLCRPGHCRWREDHEIEETLAEIEDARRFWADFLDTRFPLTVEQHGHYRSGMI